MYTITVGSLMSEAKDYGEAELELFNLLALLPGSPYIIEKNHKEIISSVNYQ